MALTYTPEGALGSPCPAFALPSVDGTRFTRDDFTGASALVIMFICNHCPYVRAIEDRLLALSREMAAQGAAFVAVCANDPADHPEDQPDQLLARWQSKNYAFPYLIDAEQILAGAMGAVCTPDLYVYDKQNKLCYRGRLDDSWRNPAHVQRQELRQAVLEVLQGKSVDPVQNPSMGCSIKWKKK